MENGEWRMENGEWRTENGKRKMENGKWKMEMENGKWKRKMETENENERCSCVVRLHVVHCAAVRVRFVRQGACGVST